MEKSRDSRVVSIPMPADLHAQVKAIAAKHKIPLNKLLLVWIESQISPGADVVIGKAHS